MVKAFTGLLLLISVCFASAQTTWSTKDSIAFWSDVMVNAHHVDHRKFANTQFEKLFFSYVSQHKSTVFQDALQEIKWISKLVAPDSSFKLFSWQHESAPKIYSYGACILFPDGRVVQLKQGLEDVQDIEYQQLTPDEWYGCLYYAIVPATHKEKNTYAVLGTSQLQERSKTKFLDFITFKTNSVVLGNAMLQHDASDHKYRRVLQYASAASCRLEFDPDEQQIKFDHLISVPDQAVQGTGMIRVPDGSYEAYALKNGEWKYVEKLETQKVAEPPRVKR